MKKRSLSIILALVLCLGLSVPALAADIPDSYQEAFKDVTLSYSLGNDTNGSITHYPWAEKDLTLLFFDPENEQEKIELPDTLPSYRAIRKDSTFTMTFNKTAEDDDSYIWIYLTFFINFGDGRYEWFYWPNVCYLNESGFVYNLLDPGYDDDLVEVRAGESVQFTLPPVYRYGEYGHVLGDYSFAEITDVVYCLTLEKRYPVTLEATDEHGDALTVMYYYDRYFYFKVDDAAVDAYLRTGFDDVPFGAYYADPVVWAVENDITVGTDDNTFSPDKTCSRAQILTFLWRAAGSPEPTAADPFTDIEPDDYYYKAALWAAEQGMVSGPVFGAETPCTRAATVEYLWKAAGSPVPFTPADFTDVPETARCAPAVAWAVENGVTEGTGANTFSPEETCSRGQIVTFLYRMWGN